MIEAGSAIANAIGAAIENETEIGAIAITAIIATEIAIETGIGTVGSATGASLLTTQEVLLLLPLITVTTAVDLLPRLRTTTPREEGVAVHPLL